MQYPLADKKPTQLSLYTWPPWPPKSYVPSPETHGDLLMSRSLPAMLRTDGFSLFNIIPIDLVSHGQGLHSDGP